MQFRWRNKTRLKCIQKMKTLPKTSFYFRQKKDTKCYCRLLYTPLLRELSWVRLPDIKSSNPRIRASLLHEYIFLPGCFAYLKQSGNHAHTLAPHCGSAAADDMKTPTNKLEFSDLNESVTQCVFCRLEKKGNREIGYCNLEWVELLGISLLQYFSFVLAVFIM